jgi:NTE family protein
MPAGNAVVLSGGGSKGAFQVGVLDELISAKKVRFDIFCGVSTGSIQALGGAMNDMPALVNHWTSIKGLSDIYKKRPLGAAGAVFGADSLFDAKALKTRLEAFADPVKLKAAKRKLLVGVVNLATGLYEDKAFDALGPGETMGEWVYASCAQPPFFKPHERKNKDGILEQWVDGGVRNVTPLSSAMKLKPRAVLAVIASPEKDPPPPGKTYDDLIKIGERCTAIQVNEIASNDVANAMLVNDLLAARESQLRQLERAGITGAEADTILAPLDVQLARYTMCPVRVIRPPKGFVGSDTMEFDPKKIKLAIEAGREAVRTQWDSLGPFLGG